MARVLGRMPSMNSMVWTAIIALLAIYIGKRIPFIQQNLGL